MKVISFKKMRATEDTEESWLKTHQVAPGQGQLCPREDAAGYWLSNAHSPKSRQSSFFEHLWAPDTKGTRKNATAVARKGIKCHGHPEEVPS